MQGLLGEKPHDPGGRLDVEDEHTGLRALPLMRVRWQWRRSLWHGYGLAGKAQAGRQFRAAVEDLRRERRHMRVIQTCHGTRDGETRDHLPGRVAHRNGEAAHALLVLLIVERVPEF